MCTVCTKKTDTSLHGYLLPLEGRKWYIQSECVWRKRMRNTFSVRCMIFFPFKQIENITLYLSPYKASFIWRSSIFLFLLRLTAQWRQCAPQTLRSTARPKWYELNRSTWTALSSQCVPFPSALLERYATAKNKIKIKLSERGSVFVCVSTVESTASESTNIVSAFQYTYGLHF